MIANVIIVVKFATNNMIGIFVYVKIVINRAMFLTTSMIGTRTVVNVEAAKKSVMNDIIG